MQSKGMWILIGVAVLAVVGFSVWGAMSPSGSSADRVVDGADITYYFGAECSHCLDVKKFLAEKNVREKVSFSEKEVWHNRANAKEMEERATACGLKKDGIGVPFLYARGKCYVGLPEVERVFEEEMGLK